MRNVEWRFTGPRFEMEWRQASGDRLPQASIAQTFDLSQPPGDDHEHVAVNEIGLELRFHWRGQVRHEVHKWPIERRSPEGKAMWSVGDEVLPPQEWAEQ